MVLSCLMIFLTMNIKRNDYEKRHYSNKNGYIEIDFDGHLKAGFKLENGCLVVLGAMDGYGNPIKIEE